MVRTTPFDETFERTMSGVTDRAFDLDVADYDDELVVTADLPGYDREDIEVAVANRTFTLRASRGHDEVTDGHEGGGAGTYLRRERRRDSVSRSVSLPAAVDETAASATYRNGVLTVTLPKTAATDGSHRIDVE
ncbi:MAG: molecular chaperone, small heat shock protein [uncultured archaeon A07HB70]|nr:MAG: molecular chaperone, small heat shock protein [uncultured archaeon A07HB70]